MSHVAAQINAVFQPVIGLPCWQIRVDENASVRINFGLPVRHITEPRPDGKIWYTRRRIVTVLGEWDLWIEHASWELLDKDLIYSKYFPGAGGPPHFVTDDEEPVPDIQIAMNRFLDGQALQAVEVVQSQRQVTLTFDLGAALVMRPLISSPVTAGQGDGASQEGPRVQDGDRTLWCLYEPGDTYFVYREDGRYYHGGDTDTERTWLGDDLAEQQGHVGQ